MNNEKFDSMAANVEKLGNHSMEDDLDIRLHDYFYRVEKCCHSPEEEVKKQGFKSITDLDKAKKDNRPPLLF